MRHADIWTTTNYGSVPMGKKRVANSRVVRENTAPENCAVNPQKANRTPKASDFVEVGLFGLKSVNGCGGRI
jgi:hypothetical protein